MLLWWIISEHSRLNEQDVDCTTSGVTLATILWNQFCKKIKYWRLEFIFYSYSGYQNEIVFRLHSWINWDISSRCNTYIFSTTSFLNYHVYWRCLPHTIVWLEGYLDLMCTKRSESLGSEKLEPRRPLCSALLVEELPEAEGIFIFFIIVNGNSFSFHYNA